MNRIKIPKGLEGSQHRFVNRAVARSFSIEDKGDVAEIELFDEIGFFGVTAKEFNARLKNIKAETINLRINSPGGEVFDGLAIFNELVDHPATINVSVTGIAASIAGIIAMAGDHIEIAENAFFMVHNASGLAFGDKSVMRKLGDILDELDGAIGRTMARRTGMSRKEVAKLMDDETWFNAESAVENGLADKIVEPGDATATFDLSVFKNAPDIGLKVHDPVKPETPRDLERCLRDAGYSRTEAKAATEAAFSMGGQRDADDAGNDGLRDAGNVEKLIARLGDFTSSIKRTLP